MLAETRLRDNEIVDENRRMILEAVRDTITASCFLIGDIANEIIFDSAEAQLQATVREIYKAVGRYCGKSARTVRYYAEAAAFFPQEIRKEYENVPFSHFVFAKQMRERCLDVLEYSARTPYTTLGGLRFEFLKFSDLLPSENENKKTGEAADETDCASSGAGFSEVENPKKSETPGLGSRFLCSHRELRVISSASELIEVIEGVVFALDMDTELRVSLIDACYVLKKNLPGLLASMRSSA